MIAAFAGARARVHGEHGRDIFDLYGKNRKYNLLRKAIRPFVNHFIAVSRDLESWLANTVGAARIVSTRSTMELTVCVFIRATAKDAGVSINGGARRIFYGETLCHW